MIFFQSKAELVTLHRALPGLPVESLLHSRWSYKSSSLLASDLLPALSHSLTWPLELASYPLQACPISMPFHLLFPQPGVSFSPRPMAHSLTFFKSFIMLLPNEVPFSHPI